ncbi:MAG TPA: MSMEG_0567/Sll0786 family nitrogen starvation N-acetyltransferase [Polyangiaceae bacterium]|nr:MSMEG_0567/Sll0786 family nitrogen starvation N-acetyltransferase [Polyangiaceae bacterium]
MLDRVHPWGRALSRQLASEVVARVATEKWELDAYYRIRRAIFAEEQGVFEASDVDEHDAHATPIVATSQIAGMPDEVVGVVRIYETEPGTWYGGRLGVCCEYRRRGAVGAALIVTACSTAHAWGCRRFFATVQARNVRYFEHHHFRALETISVRGREHALMQADLEAFPPCARALALAEARRVA